MNITVTHTISPEIVALLQAFLANTGGSVPKEIVSVVPAKSIASAPAATDPEQTTSNTTAQALTIEQVRARVNVVKTRLGSNDRIKALLPDFGVPNLTALQPDQYLAFITKVEAL